MAQNSRKQSHVILQNAAHISKTLKRNNESIDHGSSMVVLTNTEGIYSELIELYCCTKI